MGSKVTRNVQDSSPKPFFPLRFSEAPWGGDLIEIFGSKNLGIKEMVSGKHGGNKEEGTNIIFTLETSNADLSPL